MLFFFSIHAVLFLYVFTRLILPLAVSRPIKALLALPLLLATQHLLIRFFFGVLSTPPVAVWLILAEGWLYATSLALFVLLLGRDGFLLVQYLVRRSRRRGDAAGLASKPVVDTGRRAALFTMAAAVPMVYAVRSGVALPESRPMEAAFAGLPRALDGLTIAHITDLHASDLFQPEWVEGVVQRVNALKADLVILTGDLVDGSLERRREAIARLGNIRAGIGIYACPGNHEYYAGYASWTGVYRQLGITMLENTHAVRTVNGVPLTIAGVTDQVAAGFGLPMPDPLKALEHAPEDAFTLMLKHRPGNAAASAVAGAHFLLAGHTHGGHALGLNAVVRAFNNGYVHGWYTVDAMKMYVSSGAGLWNGFPVRLGVPSEIPFITLRHV